MAGHPNHASEYLLEGGRLLNLFTGELLPTNILIRNGVVAAVGNVPGRAETHHLDGGIVLPGFIDAHLHIESSLLTPPRLAEAVVPRGTTTVVADPHEIANVLGLEGVQWMLRASEGLPLECLFMAPSCVPSSDLETSGARLDAAAVGEMLAWNRVVGLAEVMNVPGVIGGDADLRRKISRARELGRPVDGHAPLLAGQALHAYVAAGIESDHECVTLDEAREKLRLGLRIMIREGSTAKNLRDLLPVVDATTARRCLLVSDDRSVVDLLEEGHVDHLLRLAVGQGLPPLWAVQMVTLNAAEHLGLRGVGAVAPGFRADLVVVDDLVTFTPRLVFKSGRLVAERGKLLAPVPPAPAAPPTMQVAPLTPDALRIAGEHAEVHVIELEPGQIETGQSAVRPRVDGGAVVADPGRDLAKLVVVDRHRGSGRVGRGLVRGFGLRRGALASSVAHDAHNLIAVGVDDGDLLTALNRIVELGGGLAVAANGSVRAQVPLEVAGLMSDAPLEATAHAVQDLEARAGELGVSIPRPFGTLSFLALPVIPKLRLTDRGLVDVGAGQLVPLDVNS